MDRLFLLLRVALISVLLSAVAVIAARPWAIRELPNTRETYESIRFLDDKTGWISGFFAGVLKTDDGGSHWIRLDSNFPTEWIESVWFFSKDRGWAVGTSYADPQKPAHIILFSKDGGHSWELQKRLEEEFSYLVDVWLMDDRHGWAVGRRQGEAFILSTDDGGHHWEPLFQDHEDRLGGEIRRIRFTDRLTGWALSSNAILHTVDGGKTWTAQHRALGLNILDVIDSKEAWAVGGWGTLLHTQNGGMTWKTSDVPGGERNYLWHVKFADRNHGWLSGAKGVLFSTLDAGQTWQPEKVDTTEVLRGIAITKTQVFILADPFQILVSSR